jgi:hypothetical protein
MKHRYNNPRCQDGGSFSLFAEWFRRELHIDVTCLFLPRQFIFYILSSLCVSNVALVFPRSVRLIDSVFSLSCVCVCVCVHFPALDDLNIYVTYRSAPSCGRWSAQ